MRLPESTSNLLDDVLKEMEALTITTQKDRRELIVIAILSAFLSAIFLVVP